MGAHSYLYLVNGPSFTPHFGQGENVCVAVGGSYSLGPLLWLCMLLPENVIITNQAEETSSHGVTEEDFSSVYAFVQKRKAIENLLNATQHLTKFFTDNGDEECSIASHVQVMVKGLEACGYEYVLLDFTEYVGVSGDAQCTANEIQDVIKAIYEDKPTALNANDFDRGVKYPLPSFWHMLLDVPIEWVWGKEFTYEAKRQEECRVLDRLLVALPPAISAGATNQHQSQSLHPNFASPKLMHNHLELYGEGDECHNYPLSWEKTDVHTYAEALDTRLV